MSRLPMNIISFAKDNEKVYEQMRDYYFNYMSEVKKQDIAPYDKQKSLAEKEEKVNKNLLSEINRVAGMSMPEGMSFEAWSTNPMVKWASFQVVSMVIDAVIPETIINSIGVYTDIKTVGFGEVAQFDVTPNSIFTVSESGNAQRTAIRQKQFKASYPIVPVNHDVTVEVALYKVLSGKESLAEFMSKAVLSIQTAMTKDAYGALATLTANANFPTALKATGYTQPTLLKLCEQVTAYNHGNKATIVGTTGALMNVLPSTGYTVFTPSDNMKIELIKDFLGYQILVLPQVASGADYGLALDDKKIYVMSTSSDKIIKGCFEGSTIQNSNDYYDNADLTSNATLNKRWKFEAVSNSAMGCVTLS